MKRFTADVLIAILRRFDSIDWKYSVIEWGYGEQIKTAWNQP